MKNKAVICYMLLLFLFLSGCVPTGQGQQTNTSTDTQNSDIPVNQSGLMGTTISEDSNESETDANNNNMPIRIVLAKEHQEQLQDEEIKKEYESIRDAFLSTNLNYQEGTINCIFIKGVYHNDEEKMTAACVFVNKMDKPVKEIHGVLRLKFQSLDAQIAKSTLDFDEDFMGDLAPDEGLLFHINIPVRGLSEDEVFLIEDIEGAFDEVRVTYSD